MAGQRPPRKGNHGSTGPKSRGYAKPGGSSYQKKSSGSGPRPGNGTGSRRPRPSGPGSPPARKPVAAARPRSLAQTERPGELVGPERLQKILAHAGIGSRRACEELILQGRVTINGQVIRELGTKVDLAKASVSVDGQKVQVERPVYFAVYKPKGYVSTNNDPSGRPRVLDLLPEIPQRGYTVGRLDEMSVGLLLLTNDGELANKLAHPKYGVEKLYRVVVAGSPTREVLSQLTEGIWLAEGKVRAKRVKAVGKRGDSTILELVLAEGKNREVRRMLAKLGHKVMMLTRVAVGPITIKGLTAGQFRPLTGREVDLLRRVADGQSVPMPWMTDRGKPLREPARPRRPENSSRPTGASGAENRPPSRPFQSGPNRPMDGPRHRSSDGPRPGPIPRNAHGSGFPAHPGLPPSERPGADRRPQGPRSFDGPPRERRSYNDGPPRHDGPRQYRDHGPRPPGRPGGYGQDRRDQGDGPRRSEGGPPRQFRDQGPRPPGRPGGYGQDRRDQNDGPPRPNGPRMFREGGGPRPSNDRGPRPAGPSGGGPRRSGPPPKQEPRERRVIGMDQRSDDGPGAGPGREDRPKPRALRPGPKRPAPRPPGGGSRPMPKPRKGGRGPSDRD